MQKFLTFSLQPTGIYFSLINNSYYASKNGQSNVFSQNTYNNTAVVLSVRAYIYFRFTYENQIYINLYFITLTRICQIKYANNNTDISGKGIKIMKKKPKKYPCEEAFLTNPVASNTDRTGFAVVVPQNDFEAESVSDMFENIPLTSHKEFTQKEDEYHWKDE